MKLTRYKTGKVANMTRGIGEGQVCWQELQEFFVLTGKNNQVIAEGSTNATIFLSKKYGEGKGVDATDNQIIDAIVNDEPIF